MTTLRTPDGRRRFEWVGDALYQRSMMDPNLEWKMSIVRNAVDSLSPEYNEKAARAKLMSRNTSTLEWGKDVKAQNLEALKKRDPILSAAIEALDLEVID